MNTEKFAHWLTIAGNLGILAGLILVAIEINQNTASVRGAAYQTWVASNLEINNATLNSDLSGAFWAGMLDPATLTKDTNLPFALWTFGYFQMVQATDYLYKSGSIDKAIWESEINRAVIHLGQPGVRQWWDAGGRTQLTPDFVQLIESSESPSSRWFWKEGIGFVPEAE